MAKKYIVELTDQERQKLKEIISKGKTAAHKIKHANILLKAEVNGPNMKDEDIAQMFSCHSRTVVNIRQRFVEQGLDAALDRRKRATPPRKKRLDGRKEATLIALACSEVPEGYSRWTVRLLADKFVELEHIDSISHETVWRTLKKTNLSLTCENAG